MTPFLSHYYVKMEKGLKIILKQLGNKNSFLDLFSIWHLLSYAQANFFEPLIARRKNP